LRRKNVEGMAIEKTANQKSVSMTSVALAETDEKMKVSSDCVDKKSGTSC
jgi:hypothetical protein